MKFEQNKTKINMVDNTKFLGVTIDTINGSSDPRIKKALKRSVSLLNIMEFIEVTKTNLNMVMFDYFWQVVIGNQPSHMGRLVFQWLGYEGQYFNQKKCFKKMLNNNDIEYRELSINDEEIEKYSTIKEELLELTEGNLSRAKFLIMEPDDIKMAIMQLKTKNGDIIRKYYIDLEKLLKLYVEYTLYFNHRESQRKIMDLEQMMVDMKLERQKDREMLIRQEQIMRQQTTYMRSLGISLEEVKDQNNELLDQNKILIDDNQDVKRKLGIAVVDRAPLPKDESKRERFVLMKYNDPNYMPYYIIRAQHAYTTRKLKTEKINFPKLEVLLDFKCNPNSKTLYSRIREDLKGRGVMFSGNNIDLEDTCITEQDLIEEMKAINDEKLSV